MPKMTTIRYKCSCMQDEAAFDMPARRFNEDTIDFMGRVTKWLSDVHSQRSPFCRTSKCEYVKIPVPEDGRPIGSSPKDAN
jgi:hypothetical protein